MLCFLSSRLHFGKANNLISVKCIPICLLLFQVACFLSGFNKPIHERFHCFRYFIVSDWSFSIECRLALTCALILLNAELQKYFAAFVQKKSHLLIPRKLFKLQFIFMCCTFLLPCSEYIAKALLQDSQQIADMKHLKLGAKYLDGVRKCSLLTNIVKFVMYTSRQH